MMSQPRIPASEFAAFKRGDELGFKYYYRLYRPDLYTCILSRVKRPDEATDICTETFTNLWLSIDKIQDENHLRYFLYDTAENLCNMSFQLISRQLEEEMTFVHSLEADTPDNTEQEKTEVLLRLAESIEQLPPKRRRTIKLFYYSEMTVKKIAEFLGLSNQTVRNNLNKAREGLRGKKNSKKTDKKTFLSNR
jgi:RNA polymerase sigma factor (sigma-70 family)